MVNVKEITSAGHEERMMDSEAAAEFIRNYVVTNLKWLYLDGVFFRDAENVQPADLESASDITLTNQLVGG